MKKGLMVKSFVFLTALAFLFVSMPLYAQEKEIKLRYSVIWPQMHPLTKLMVEWGKDIEKATQGGIKTTMLASK